MIKLIRTKCFKCNKELSFYNKVYCCVDNRHYHYYFEFGSQRTEISEFFVITSDLYIETFQGRSELMFRSKIEFEKIILNNFVFDPEKHDVKDLMILL